MLNPKFLYQRQKGKKILKVVEIEKRRRASLLPKVEIGAKNKTRALRKNLKKKNYYK